MTWMSSSWQLAPHSRRRAASSAARSGAPGGASSMQTSSRPAARSTGATSAAASAVAHTATARTSHDVRSAGWPSARRTACILAQISFCTPAEQSPVATVSKTL